jgi:hypothetical protein
MPHSFVVCDDVVVGPRLPISNPDELRESWGKVALSAPENKGRPSEVSLTKAHEEEARQEEIEWLSKMESFAPEGSISEIFLPLLGLLFERPPGFLTTKELKERTAKLEANSPEPPKSTVEAMGMNPLSDATDIVFCELSSTNLLAKAVHVAFFKHYPLRLSPDIIWLTCIQGLAKHIEKNPEKHRDTIGVKFQGKKTVTVNRAGFAKGSSENNWESVFPEFAENVAGHIGEDMVELLECSFSTTTSTDKVSRLQVQQLAQIDTATDFCLTLSPLGSYPQDLLPYRFA